MKKIVIFDLDGTLALIDHLRLQDWKSYFKPFSDYKTNDSVIAVLRALSSAGYFIQIFSDRDDVVRPQTEAWLKKHNIIYDDLRMRQDGDSTPDDELKRFWVKGIESQIICTFEDRRKAVDMWRSLEIPCFQVAPGDILR